jgi:hypothetical protein
MLVHAGRIGEEMLARDMHVGLSSGPVSAYSEPMEVSAEERLEKSRT